jgi:hypothetical protein
MSFFRHEEIYRSDVGSKHEREPAETGSPDHRLDESPAGYSLAGCSPAEPASASPTASSMGWGITAGNELSANGNLSLISVSQPRGSLQLKDCYMFSAGRSLRLRIFCLEVQDSRDFPPDPEPLGREVNILGIPGA